MTALSEAWVAALRHFGALEDPAAEFSTRLLLALRDGWAATVRPDSSMLTLLFTRPDETGHRFTERVEVAMEEPDRVRVALVRDIPRRGLDRPGGRTTVTADFTRPENALPAVEALLHQLAQPVSGQG